MTKKICLISNTDFSLEQFIIPSAKEMKKNGFEVTLLSPMNYDFEEEYSSEFRLINIPLKRGIKFVGLVKSIVLLYRIFEKEKFQIIQYTSPNASFYASIAGYLCNIPARIYCQWGIRYVEMSKGIKWIFKFVEILTCRLSTHIRPASRKNMDLAICERHYRREKALVIGEGGAVGVDLNIFDITKKDQLKKEILKKYSFLEGKNVLGFIGRINRDKGIEELIKAFVEYYKINEKIHLLIIGPDDNDGRIKKEILDSGKNHKGITFIGYTNEVQKYLGIIDILVHPTYREGFSLVIQQAMAMGIPVITTDIPGPSEVIEKDLSGLLIPPKNVKKLKEAIEYLVNNKDKRLIFGKNGFERINKFFTQKEMSKLIVADRQQIFNSLNIS